MHLQLPKALKKKVRELSRLGYERELSKALSQLEKDFEQWRQKQLDAFLLSDRIHAFHQGPSQELYKQWELTDADMMVGYAVVRGIITEAEAGPEVLKAVSRWIAFFRDSELTAVAPEAPPNQSPRGD